MKKSAVWHLSVMVGLTKHQRTAWHQHMSDVFCTYLHWPHCLKSLALPVKCCEVIDTLIICTMVDRKQLYLCIIRSCFWDQIVHFCSRFYVYYYELQQNYEQIEFGWKCLPFEAVANTLCSDLPLVNTEYRGGSPTAVQAWRPCPLLEPPLVTP